MGRAISLDDIPAPASGGGNAYLLDEAIEFEESGEPAYELREYETSNSARSTVSRLNAMFREREMPIEALSRGMVVYLRRIDLDEAPKPRKKRAAR